VVGDTTSKVYGHVVASDVFGTAYVVPIEDLLRDIRLRLSAVSVNLAPDFQNHSVSFNTESPPPRDDRAKRRGDEIKITDQVVEAAAGNLGNGQEVMALLLDRRRDKIKINLQDLEVEHMASPRDWSIPEASVGLLKPRNKAQGSSGMALFKNSLYLNSGYSTTVCSTPQRAVGPWIWAYRNRNRLVQARYLLQGIAR
jgi:hypothetical protein